MARKQLSAWETEQKKQFDEAIKKHSAQAVENIWKIANSAMDMRTRLLANQYIIDKFVGKDYRVCKEEERQQLAGTITINLLPTGNEYKQNKQDEQEIWDAENNLLCEDTEDDEGWGEDDIYIPNK